MADGEGGGGVMGEPDIKSEEKQPFISGRPNTDGTRQPVMFILSLIVWYCITECYTKVYCAHLDP